MVKNHPIGEEVYFSDYRPLNAAAPVESASLAHTSTR